MTIKVFIASRFGEFGPLRDALKQYHKNDQIAYIALDDGHPSVLQPLDRSLTELDDADLMVLFQGETIGPQVENLEGVKKSIVEHEWDFAQSAGIPCLVWFKRELIEKFSDGEEEEGNPSHSIESELSDDRRLKNFKKRIEKTSTVGLLSGEDSLKVAQRIEIQIFNQVIARGPSSANLPGNIQHDNQFVEEFRRKSKMYGMPLKATGPQYAQESLIAREGCADLIERGLPSDAIKLLRKLDIKSVTDVCTLWILGELFCRYSNEFSRDEFTPEVLKLASRLFDMRKSMPIGLVSPDSKEDYRCGLVVLLVSRLLLAVKAQSLLNNDVVANGEEFRELMKNALSALSNTNVYQDEVETKTKMELHLESLAVSPESLKAKFFEVWHWRPNLAINTLRLLPIEDSRDLVNLAINEAKRDFRELPFGEDIFKPTDASDLDPASVLKKFRQKMNSLVAVELKAITSLFLALDPLAAARSKRLEQACKYPTVFVKKYQPPQRPQKHGDIYKSSGYWKIEILTVRVPSRCDFGDIPLHEFNETPDLVGLWQVIKARGEDKRENDQLLNWSGVVDLLFKKVQSSTPSSNSGGFTDRSFDELWKDLCSDSTPDLLDHELKTRESANTLLRVFHEADMIKSALRSLPGEFSFDEGTLEKIRGVIIDKSDQHMLSILTISANQYVEFSLNEEEAREIAKLPVRTRSFAEALSSGFLASVRTHNDLSDKEKHRADQLQADQMVEQSRIRKRADQLQADRMVEQSRIRKSENVWSLFRGKGSIWFRVLQIYVFFALLSMLISSLEQTAFLIPVFSISVLTLPILAVLSKKRMFPFPRRRTGLGLTKAGTVCEHREKAVKMSTASAGFCKDCKSDLVFWEYGVEILPRPSESA